MLHNLRMQLFNLYSSKIEVSKSYSFDTVTTHNDQPSYVKHVLRHISVFFTPFGDWVWCATNGVVRNLLMQFFSLYSSKVEVSEAYFFDIVIT